MASVTSTPQSNQTNNHILDDAIPRPPIYGDFYAEVKVASVATPLFRPSTHEQPLSLDEFKRIDPVEAGRISTISSALLNNRNSKESAVEQKACSSTDSRKGKYRKHLDFLANVRNAINNDESLDFADEVQFDSEDLPEVSESLLRIAVQHFNAKAIKLFCNLKCKYTSKLGLIVFSAMKNDVEKENYVRIDQYREFIIKIIDENPDYITPFFLHRYLLLNFEKWPTADFHTHFGLVLSAICKYFDFKSKETLKGLDREQLDFIGRGEISSLLGISNNKITKCIKKIKKLDKAMADVMDSAIESFNPEAVKLLTAEDIAESIYDHLEEDIESLDHYRIKCYFEFICEVISRNKPNFSRIFLHKYIVMLKYPNDLIVLNPYLYEILYSVLIRFHLDKMSFLEKFELMELYRVKNMGSNRFFGISDELLDQWISYREGEITIPILPKDESEKFPETCPFLSGTVKHPSAISSFLKRVGRAVQ